MFKRLVMITSVLVFCLISGLAAAMSSNSPVGYWITYDHKNSDAKDSIVHIIRNRSGQYEGKIIHIYPEAGHKTTDLCMACKDDLYRHPILGMKILWGFNQVGEGKFADGRVLDPNSGSIYHCTMHLKNEGRELRVHGYIGIPLFGRSDVWVRTHMHHKKARAQVKDNKIGTIKHSKV